MTRQERGLRHETMSSSNDEFTRPQLRQALKHMSGRSTNGNATSNSVSTLIVTPLSTKLSTTDSQCRCGESFFDPHFVTIFADLRARNSTNPGGRRLKHSMHERQQCSPSYALSRSSVVT